MNKKNKSLVKKELTETVDEGGEKNEIKKERDKEGFLAFITKRL